MGSSFGNIISDHKTKKNKMKLLAPFALIALAFAEDPNAAKKKAGFVATAVIDHLETCHPLMGTNTLTKPTFDGVKRDMGLSDEAQEDIIKEIISNNRKKFDNKSDKEILDLKALAEKFKDKALIEKFEKVIVIKK